MTSQLFIDGFHILLTFWKELFILCLSGMGLGTLIAHFFFRKKQQTSIEIILIFTGFSIIGILMIALKYFGIFRFSLVASIFGLGMLSFLIWFKDLYTKYGIKRILYYSWLPSILFLFFLIIRLGFIESLLLPPYSDSPIHYSIIQTSLSPDTGSLHTSKIINHYYHLGFHGIVAWVSILSDNSTPIIIALIGQFFLALLPISVYLWVYSFSNSLLMAFISAILAGFGWNMPSYATNWGKYPTLVGIALLPLFFGVLQFSVREKNKKTYLLSLLIAISLIWIHSRIALLILFFLLAYRISSFSEKKGIVEDSLWIISLFSLIIVTQSLLNIWVPNEYFRFYEETFSGASYLVLLLLAFAFLKHSKNSLFFFLWLSFILLGTIISIPYTPSIKMIDRPFFEAVFFLPLAALGGLGAKGLSDFFDKKGTDLIIATTYAFLLFLNAMLFLSYTPADISNYVEEDDLFAIHWVNDYLPIKAKIVIAGEKHLNNWITTDAGGWINILTKREIYKLPYDFNWQSSQKVQALCQNLENDFSHFVYVGSTTQKHFDFSNAYNSAWIESTLYLPDAQIYQLNCQFEEK